MKRQGTRHKFGPSCRVVTCRPFMSYFLTNGHLVDRQTGKYQKYAETWIVGEHFQENKRWRWRLYQLFWTFLLPPAHLGVCGVLPPKDRPAGFTRQMLVISRKGGHRDVNDEATVGTPACTITLVWTMLSWTRLGALKDYILMSSNLWPLCLPWSDFARDF